MIAVLLLTLGSLFNFVSSNFIWLKPFGRDLWRWLLAPQVAGGVSAPQDWALWLLMVAVAFVGAWMASDMALHSTELANDGVLKLGTAIVLAVAIVGYSGTIALATGTLESPVIWLTVGGLAVAATLARQFLKTRIVGTPPATLSAEANSPHEGRWTPSISWFGWPFAAAALVFTTAHNLMAPITETDATIYHAAAAKLWFLGRPAPPLLYGPSVGIEISANYPPLFPAVGAASYTVIGQFDDIYLRAIPSILSVGLLLVTFSYARWHSGRTAAWWVIVLVLGSPLVIMYMAWATNYILLGALTLLVVVYCDLGATSNRLSCWVAAGAFAGLAVLTNFYGWLAYGIAIVAILVWTRTRFGVISFGVFALTAAVVSSPWLVRNWVLLGDPIYPLANAWFSGRGLVQPLWNASQTEIERSALSVLGSGQGVGLFGHELGIALESGYLLPVGLILGLAVGMWQSWLGDKRSTYLMLVVAAFILTVLAPGWYWLRALLPLIPIAAVLTGRVFNFASDWAKRNNTAPGLSGFGAGLWNSTLIATALISSITGLALAFAGPNQQTWTTALPASTDHLQAVRNLGSPTQQLATAFGGDYQSWQWLNAHMGPNDKVATFELRMYYFARPNNLFYLDGIEAVPLLGLNSPEQVRDYLIAHRVRYIMVPAWARDLHPAVNLLPLMTMLGEPGGFPTIVDWGNTAVYAVGPSSVSS